MPTSLDGGDWPISFRSNEYDEKKRKAYIDTRSLVNIWSMKIDGTGLPREF
jgi:hypothetical protein